ncbi:hypothetical protein GWP26_00610 [Corynebacterium macginleyi]|nr:hypothetical protein [Corynebacterium macginleyi]MBK4162545.1 hypothetical protein [Corynebacterium macginleyi]MBK4179449.1 hypothetical protein [Corynebacterium macginleyi]MBK4183384.1 hypothetical protein [Corynebacterium macginleyi]
MKSANFYSDSMRMSKQGL